MSGAWTAAQLPCLSLPPVSSAAGLPIGLQIIGASSQDIALLDVGAKIEAAMAHAL